MQKIAKPLEAQNKICELFSQANLPYNLCQDVKVCSQNIGTDLYVTESLDLEIKDSKTEESFQKKD